MLRSLMAAMALLAGPAVAQMPSVEAKACERRGGKIERADEARDLRDEAERFRGNAQNVTRQRDGLLLKLEGGKTAELTDCPYGDGAYAYLYERYDEAGPFYVVRKRASEDFAYALVMKRTGRLGIRDSDRSQAAPQGCRHRAVRGDRRALQGEGRHARANLGRAKRSFDPLLLPRPGHGRGPVAAARQGSLVRELS